jgi:hypothetical protein
MKQREYEREGKSRTPDANNVSFDFLQFCAADELP